MHVYVHVYVQIKRNRLTCNAVCNTDSQTY